MREQCIVLEHDPDVSPIRRLVRDIALAEADGAGARLGETGDYPQRRRLAAAGGTEQYQQLAFRDLERKIVHGQYLAEALADVVERDRGH